MRIPIFVTLGEHARPKESQRKVLSKRFHIQGTKRFNIEMLERRSICSWYSQPAIISWLNSPWELWEESLWACKGQLRSEIVWWIRLLDSFGILYEEFCHLHQDAYSDTHIVTQYHRFNLKKDTTQSTNQSSWLWVGHLSITFLPLSPGTPLPKANPCGPRAWLLKRQSISWASILRNHEYKPSQPHH